MGPFFSSPMRKLGSFRQEIDHKLPSPDPNFELCPVRIFTEEHARMQQDMKFTWRSALDVRTSTLFGIVTYSSSLFNHIVSYCIIIFTHYRPIRICLSLGAQNDPDSASFRSLSLYRPILKAHNMVPIKRKRYP